MIEIVLVDQNDFVIEAALEEMTYFLRFSWNSEAQFWVMGIRNANNEEVLQGVVLVPNVVLLSQFSTLAVPPGQFLVNTANPLEVIDRDAFITGRATLYYILEEEYAAL